VVAVAKQEGNPDGKRDSIRDLKDLYERKARAVTRRPELARNTGLVRVRSGGQLSPGQSSEALVCTVDEGGRSRAVELPGEEAQPRANPSPAELLRASLAASLAMGYRLWAARLEVAIAAVEVELRTDDDVRGQLLLDSDVGPGWQRIHVVVTISSGAPAGDLARVVDLANRHCLVLATLSREIDRAFHLRVVAPT
jgi:uncharacterized OsmC-like protein